MDGKSLDITEEKRNRLKDVLPEAFTEDKIDWEKLKAALGEDIEFKNERYVLNWAGKSDAFRVLQTPTTATLVPCAEESIGFDDTENIFIEGENLEVLKVLQKSYFGKIKMIYIDPPYNTGNDKFIYPDKFSETKEEYLSRVGVRDENGYMTREGMFRKNSSDNGHYHSNWLSMMYPRLFLARNLLREDGVIFVSIDDNEVHNLRLMLNEVFGEENFISTLIWKKKAGGGSDAKYIADDHEYVLIYAKNESTLPRLFVEMSDELREKYMYEDEYVEERGQYQRKNLHQTGIETDRPNLIYPIEAPDGTPVYPPTIWRWSKEAFEKARKDGRIEILKNSKDEWAVYTKMYLFEDGEERKVKPRSILSNVGYTRNGNKDVKEIFGEKIYDYPKPVSLIKHIISILSDGNSEEMILDFFSGSSTTAHAVLDLNKEDGGNRKFIMVQLPEKCDEKSEAYKAGYETIAEIGKERIRRVIKKIKTDPQTELDIDGATGKQDLGFKVFKLQQSNFKIWQSNVKTEEELVTQLTLHTDPVDENATIENILYELLLKSGVPLTARIEEKEGYYLVNGGEIALILEKVNESFIKKVIAENPNKVITLDRLFNNNDQLKTNTALQMKDAGIEFKAV